MLQLNANAEALTWSHPFLLLGCVLLFASIVRNYHGTQKAMLNFCYPKLLLRPPAALAHPLTK